MYTRLLKPPRGKSFFLFGPRGTGKTTWTRQVFPRAVRIDLLEARLHTQLLADPQRLGTLVPERHADWVVVDEIQKIPALLDEVHRLIETRGLKFALTGSSARKLRRGGVNLLGGRALNMSLHPLAACEMGGDFDLAQALQHGSLPSIPSEEDPRRYLEGYVAAYLEQEVKQEGLTRNLASFARFLEAASFSQAAVLNISSVARECSVERKVVEGYFNVLEDLLIACRLPPFTRRASRRMSLHPKFFFFDTGVYRAIRPSGPLDSREEAEGPAAETLLLQNLQAVNDSLGLGYRTHYWRTSSGTEVDLVLYGGRGLWAFEVKRRGKASPEDASGLRAFKRDFPKARCLLVYGGDRRLQWEGVEVWPMESLLRDLPKLL